MRSVLPLTSRGEPSRYIKGMKEFGGGKHGGLLLQGELAKKRPPSNRKFQVIWRIILEQIT